MIRHFSWRYRDLRLERGRWLGRYRQVMPTHLVGFWFRPPFSHVHHIMRLRPWATRNPAT